MGNKIGIGRIALFALMLALMLNIGFSLGELKLVNETAGDLPSSIPNQSVPIYAKAVVKGCSSCTIQLIFKNSAGKSLKEEIVGGKSGDTSFSSIFYCNSYPNDCGLGKPVKVVASVRDRGESKVVEKSVSINAKVDNYCPNMSTTTSTQGPIWPTDKLGITVKAWDEIDDDPKEIEPRLAIEYAPGKSFSWTSKTTKPQLPGGISMKARTCDADACIYQLTLDCSVLKCADEVKITPLVFDIGGKTCTDCPTPPPGNSDFSCASEIKIAINDLATPKLSVVPKTPKKTDENIVFTATEAKVVDSKGISHEWTITYKDKFGNTKTETKSISLAKDVDDKSEFVFSCKDKCDTFLSATVYKKAGSRQSKPATLKFTFSSVVPQARIELLTQDTKDKNKAFAFRAYPPAGFEGYDEYDWNFIPYDANGKPISGAQIIDSGLDPKVTNESRQTFDCTGKCDTKLRAEVIGKVGGEGHVIAYRELTWRKTVTPVVGNSSGKPWQGPVVIAIFIAVILPTLAYLLASLLKYDALKAIVKDEFAQILFAVMIAGVLLAGLGPFSVWLSQFMCGYMGIETCAAGVNLPDNKMLMCKDITSASSGTSGSTASCPALSVNQWALNINQRQSELLVEFMASAQGYNDKLGEAGARSGFVSLLGVGMGIAGCSAYSALRGPVGQMINAAGFGLMDLEAERFIMNMNEGVLLSLLLPVGILLRAIHFTKKAGSALLALCISFYLIFPASLLLGNSLADRFIAPSSDPANPNPYQNFAKPPAEIVKNDIASKLECDPFDPDEDVLVNFVDKLLHDPSKPSDPGPADYIIFWVVVRTLLMTAFALTATLSAARALSHLMNTDLDVSAISRLS